MKKAASLFCVILCYLMAAIGTPWFAHFCGGEQVLESPFVKAISCCQSSENASDEPKGCCQNKASWKVADDHSAVFSLPFPPSCFYDLPKANLPIFAGINLVILRPTLEKPSFWRPPPLIFGRQILILFNQLLI